MRPAQFLTDRHRRLYGVHQTAKFRQIGADIFARSLRLALSRLSQSLLESFSAVFQVERLHKLFVCAPLFIFSAEPRNIILAENRWNGFNNVFEWIIPRSTLRTTPARSSNVRNDPPGEYVKYGRCADADAVMAED